MPTRRDIRRLAMQAMYQLDLGTPADAASLAASLDDEFDAPSVRSAAVELAMAAWGDRSDADTHVTALSPAWPTHRQPPVDRAILRLAYHEMVSGHAPAKVAINEAVELAKRYAAEASSAFVNGVLDKLARELDEAGRLPAKPAAESADEAWLRDATGDEGEAAR
ncbi:MAG: transcription antitermination factor NusB [Phycisphaeraceae bacterium]